MLRYIDAPSDFVSGCCRVNLKLLEDSAEKSRCGRLFWVEVPCFQLMQPDGICPSIGLSTEGPVEQLTAQYEAHLAARGRT